MRAAGTRGVCRLGPRGVQRPVPSSGTRLASRRICCSVCRPMPVALAYRRHLGWGVTLAALVFGFVWVFFFADRPAHSDPTTFFSTLLDAITQGALYFVVASGFTLVFGLMRVVNMAHGSLYLVAAYVGHQPAAPHHHGQPRRHGLLDAGQHGQLVRRPALRGRCSSGVLGLAMQQLLPALEPGPGPAPGADHDRALGDRRRPGRRRTRAAAWPRTCPSPGGVNQFVDLHVSGFSYSGSAALHPRPRTRDRRSRCGSGCKRTRTGMVIRAGVDDRAMVAALGVNIQRTFMIAFFVGSALAGMGARDRHVADGRVPTAPTASGCSTRSSS